MTAEEEYAMYFIEQRKKFCLSLRFNGVKSYLFVNGVEIYKFKSKDSEINTSPSCLVNVSKDLWKVLDYTDVSMIFQSIMID